MKTISAAPNIRRAVTAVTAAVVAVVVAPDLPAQSAADVLRTAVEKHNDRMEGVENYTVVQEAMGFETTSYYERTTVDGESVFVVRSSLGSEVGKRAPGNPYAFVAEMADRATLEGKESVDGEACHIVSITDFSGADLSALGVAGENENWSPQRMRIWIDADDHYPRKMTMQGTAAMNGEPQEMSFTAHLRDYRTVEGVVHPFRTEVSIQGMGQQMSRKDQEEARKSLEQLRKQMAEMPPQQREMMEKMMGGQLERMEKLLASGAMDFTVQVKEIRVNEGPPQGQGY